MDIILENLHLNTSYILHSLFCRYNKYFPFNMYVTLKNTLQNENKNV